MKRCYYEILAVEKKATTSEIKSAYRKMAMKYHPDKNPTEEGKKIFLEVQEAYDVLSDPNERTFYDNNRQKILFNKDQMSKEDLEQYSFGFNIWEFFTVRCFKGYNDEEGSFYNVYREVFEKIKAEQAKAFKSRDDLEEDMRKYQGFGASNTNIDKVLAFYNDWQNFTTYKTFSWSEQYDIRDAQNRWVKRRMQEQNKKERQKEKKNYIKTIKDLANFVKKRDLRFQQHLAQVREEQERKEKEKIKKQEEKKKEKQDMKKVKQKLEEERFREIEEYYKQNNAPEEKHHVYDDDEELPQFYCPICEKSFKSENQLLNHEKSKIHKQNVKLLQKEVMLPGQKVEEDEEQQVPQNVPEQSKKKRNRKKKNKNANTPGNQQEKDEQEQKPQKKPQIVNTKKTNEQKKKVESDQSEQEPKNKNNKNANKNQKKQQPKPQPKPTKKQSQSEQSSDDDDAFMSLIKNKTNKASQNEEKQAQKNNNSKKNQKQKQKAAEVKPIQKNILNMVESSGQEAGGDEKKLGKAKLKKMKKAEQQKDTGLKCKTCGVVFPSKTKLFDHLKQSGHAAFK